METTLTIRLPKRQREALKRRAAAEKCTESALVRELIDREMQRAFDFQRVRHVVGSVASPRKHWEKDPGKEISANATGVHDHVSLGYRAAGRIARSIGARSQLGARLHDSGDTDLSAQAP